MSGDEDDFAARVGAGSTGSEAGDWDDDDEAPPFSDEDLALRFAALHVYTMRYVAMWGRWFKWTGKVMLLIPGEAAHRNEMMSPVVTE